MFKRIDGVVLFVNDLTRSVEFYRNKLGLKVKVEEEGFVDFETETIPLGLMDVKEAVKLFGEKAVLVNQEAGHRLELSVNVGNVDEIYEQFKARGVEFLRSPADQPWGQRTADFIDPDGNIWEIYHWLPKTH